MTKAKTKTRVKQLRREIEHHRYLYHVRDTQEISDAALDSLKQELVELEQTYPDLITTTSPTQRVGGQPLDKFKKVTHSTPMLSLQDAFTRDDIDQWVTRNQKLVAGPYQYFLQDKIDGLALALIYKDGQLIKGVTRGNGKVGEDVTHNIKTIDAIPLQLTSKIKGTVEVRGEVYMRKADFTRLNKRRTKAGLAAFANPRNVAAGSIRQLDPKLTQQRPLRFFAWELTRGPTVKSRLAEYVMLQALGFPVPPGAKVYKSIDVIANQLAISEPERERALYLVDGAVIKINDLNLAQRLGVAGKAPRASLAYKYAAAEATTTVEDIIVQVGRTGALTPVAHLKPVSVAGSTVSRATLHNAEEIARKDVRVGDTVIIRKAGDIIPEIIKVLKNLRPATAKPFKFPTRCPICGGPIHQDKDGVVQRCANKNCFPRQRERIIHALGKDGFDIEGLGDKIVTQLLQSGLIKDAPDVWQLAEGDLTALERFADKSASNLITAIQASKPISLARFILALGIPQVGTVTAQDLAREYKTIKKMQSVSIAQLQDIEGVGKKVAADIVAYLAEPQTKDLVKRYLAAGIKIKSVATAGTLSSKTFVFTGSLGDMSRGEAKQIVLSKGGKVATSAGPKVSYVVIGQDAGSKAAKAKQLGLTTLTPAQFEKMIS